MTTQRAYQSLDRFLSAHLNDSCIQNSSIHSVIGVLNILGSGAFADSYKACYPITRIESRPEKTFFFFTRYKRTPTCDPDAIVIAVKRQDNYRQDRLFTEETLSRKVFDSESPFWTEFISYRLASELKKSSICPFFIDYVRPAL